MWLTQDLRQTSPSFTQVPDYPFRYPTRVLFNPYNLHETWVVNFGGGLRVQTDAGGKGDAALVLLLMD